jgi:integrase
MSAKFPASLPESLRKLLPSGCSLFPRPEKRRWVFAYQAKGGGRPQKVIPGEIVEPRAAVEYVLTFLRAQGIDPGANLDRRKVEGPTVGSCADRWIVLAEKDPKVAPATLAGYRYHLRAHILPTFGDAPIVALPRMMPELRKWIREGFPGASARTVQHAVSAFTVLVDVAIAEAWISVEGDDLTRHAVNPLRSPAVRGVIPEAEDDDPQALPLATVQALVAAVDRVPLERRARYAVAFCEGFRDGEVAGVKISRVQRRETPATIEVVVSVATVGSKVDGATKWAQPKAPKTKGSKRKLPLHRCADAAIGEWLAVGWPALVGRQPTDDDYLFPRPDGQPARPRSAELLRADLEACGLPSTIDGRPVEFKATRSSFATWLDDAGVDKAVRKRLMGHVVSDVTDGRYTRREIERLAEAVERIGLDWPALIPAAGTLPAMVPSGTTIDPNLLESLSHLRDLNSRPTVYETVALPLS